MFAGMALGSLVNHNLTRVEMIAYLPTVKLMIQRVLELDSKNKPENLAHAALPWVTMGMIYTGASVSFGGDPKRGHSQQVIQFFHVNNSLISPRLIKVVPDIGSTYSKARPEGVPSIFFDQSMPSVEYMVAVTSSGYMGRF